MNIYVRAGIVATAAFFLVIGYSTLVVAIAIFWFPIESNPVGFAVFIIGAMIVWIWLVILAMFAIGRKAKQ